MQTTQELRQTLELRYQRRLNWLLHIAVALLSVFVLTGNPFSLWDDYVTLTIWLTLAVRAGRAALRALIERGVARELQRQQQALDTDASRQMARYTLQEKRKGDIYLESRVYRPLRSEEDGEQIAFPFLDDEPTQKLKRTTSK